MEKCRWLFPSGRRDIPVSQSSPARWQVRRPRPEPNPAHPQNLVLVTGQIGVLQEPRLRPGKSPGCVEKPVVECITRAAAQRRDEVELFGDGAGLELIAMRRCRRRDSSGTRYLLQFRPAAATAADNCSRTACRQTGCRMSCTASTRVRIEQRVAAVSSAVSDMAADIEPRPIVVRDWRRFEGHRVDDRQIRCRTIRRHKQARRQVHRSTQLELFRCI